MIEKNNEIDGNDFLQTDNLDAYLEMDIRVGTTPEQEEISNNPFLSRGIAHLDTTPPTTVDYKHGCCKLGTHDWIDDLSVPSESYVHPICEVRFKNSHKEFFRLPEEGIFKIGEVVAVESQTGYDIGIVSMVGISVKRQMEARKVNNDAVTRKLLRHARLTDLEKWVSTINMEHTTMLSSRYIAWDLNLKMKVNDVEYQGDGSKAIFYYSAEERVDFRELIKILAEQFKIRIEMRQIGVRQEASRLGGIGTCGRELCCSAWLTHFQSVSTTTARTQQLSLNPQKLAGMCSKLKCCLNFEQSSYLEELKNFPPPNTHLFTKKGKAYYNKIDIFKKIIWYSYANDHSTIFAIPVEEVKKIIAMNKAGENPESLEKYAIVNQKKVDEGGNFSLSELKNIEDK